MSIIIIINNNYNIDTHPYNELYWCSIFNIICIINNLIINYITIYKNPTIASYKLINNNVITTGICIQILFMIYMSVNFIFTLIILSMSCNFKHVYNDDVLISLYLRPRIEIIQPQLNEHDIEQPESLRSSFQVQDSSFELQDQSLHQVEYPNILKIYKFNECSICLEHSTITQYNKLCGHMAICDICLQNENLKLKCGICRKLLNTTKIQFESELCIKCTKHPPTHLFNKCGHLCICDECSSETMNKCPKCNENEPTDSIG